MKHSTADAIAESAVNTIASGPNGVALLRDRSQFLRVKAQIVLAIAAGIEGERKEFRALVRRVFHLSDPSSDVYHVLGDYIDNDPLMNQMMDLDILKQEGGK